MGLPSIVIEFTKKARNIIERSSRGVVLLLLKDDTKEQVVNQFETLADVVKTDWTDENYKYIALAFMGKPASVIAVRGKVESDHIDIEQSKHLFENLNYDYFAFPECRQEDKAGLVRYFDNAKKKKYKKGKAVLANIAADSYAVINFTTSDISILYNGRVEQVSTEGYTARIAGLLAGTSLLESSTYKVLSEVVDIKQSLTPDSDIDAGKFIIIFDGEKFKVGRGVTSLTTVSEEIPVDFKKIKLVEASDIIKNDIITTFENHYVGKKNNSYDNKQMFIGAILAYLKEMEDVLIDKDEGYSIELDIAKIRAFLENDGKDTSKMSNLDIAKANTASYIALSGKFKLLDAMEDMKLKIAI